MALRMIKQVALVKEPKEFENEVNKIENMCQSAVVQATRDLNELQARDSIMMGGFLSRIRKNRWVAPHANFNLWVENELGMKRGKANALANMYDRLVECGVANTAVKEIGWTKIRAIGRVIDKENAEFWITRAHRVSKAQLIEEVRAHMGTKLPATKTFKIYADQNPVITMALEKAKDVGATEHNGVALEYICLDYMSGQGFDKSVNQLSASSLVDLIVAGLKGRDDATIEHVLREVLKKLGCGKVSYP